MDETYPGNICTESRYLDQWLVLLIVSRISRTKNYFPWISLTFNTCGTNYLELLFNSFKRFFFFFALDVARDTEIRDVDL
jgi:hypothetical protein